MESITSLPFYWPHATRTSSEDVLRQHKVDGFLVRPSSQAGCVTISYREPDGRLFHSPVKCSSLSGATSFTLVQTNESYSSFESALKHWTMDPIVCPLHAAHTIAQLSPDIPLPSARLTRESQRLDLAESRAMTPVADRPIDRVMADLFRNDTSSRSSAPAAGAKDQHDDDEPYNAEEVAEALGLNYDKDFDADALENEINAIVNAADDDIVDEHPLQDASNMPNVGNMDTIPFAAMERVNALDLIVNAPKTPPGPGPESPPPVKPAPRHEVQHVRQQDLQEPQKSHEHAISTAAELRAMIVPRVAVSLALHGADVKVDLELDANVTVMELLPTMTKALEQQLSPQLADRLTRHFCIQVVRITDKRPSIQWINVHQSLNMQRVNAGDHFIIWSHADIRAPFNALPFLLRAGWVRIRVTAHGNVLEPPRRWYVAATPHFLFLFAPSDAGTKAIASVNQRCERIINLQLYSWGASNGIVLRQLTVGTAADRHTADVEILPDPETADPASDMVKWTAALRPHCGAAVRHQVFGVPLDVDFVMRRVAADAKLLHVPKCTPVGCVPLLLQRCTSWLDENLGDTPLASLLENTEHSPAALQASENIANTGVIDFSALDACVVVRILLRHLSTLPHFLISDVDHQRFEGAIFDAHIDHALGACSAILAAMPPVSRVTLSYVLWWFHRRAVFDAQGSSDAAAVLAVRFARVLASCIIHLPTDASRMSVCMDDDTPQETSTALTFLLQHADRIVSDEWLALARDRACKCKVRAPRPSGQAPSPPISPRSGRGDIRIGNRSPPPPLSPRSTRPASLTSLTSLTSPTSPTPTSPALVQFRSQRTAPVAGSTTVHNYIMVGGKPVHEYIVAARKHGWILKKRKKRMVRFQKRYFAVCSNGMLYYFSGPTAEEPLGQFNMLGASVSRMDATTSSHDTQSVSMGACESQDGADASGKGGGSSASFGSSKSRELLLRVDGVRYVLQLSSLADRESWLHALDTAIAEQVASSRRSFQQMASAMTMDALLDLPENQHCADCLAALDKQTAQCLVHVGMFVCVPCAAAHRRLERNSLQPDHAVDDDRIEVTECRKATDKSKWTDELLAIVAARGNERGAALWEATLIQLPDKGAGVRPHAAAATQAERMAFIRAKYIDKLYFDAAQLTEDDMNSNAAHEHAQQEEVMMRRKLARLSVSVAARSKGLLNFDIVWSRAVAPRSPIVVARSLLTELAASRDRFVGVDHVLLDALRHSQKLRSEIADNPALRVAQAFLMWSERSAELQTVEFTGKWPSHRGVSLSLDQTRAFWLNVHSCIIGHIACSIFGGAAVNKQDWARALLQPVYNVGGFELSADDILHGILRNNAGMQFGPKDRRCVLALPLDPRIHFVRQTWLADAPPLAPLKETEDALEEATRVYLGRHVRVTFRDGTISLPHVIQECRDDFGDVLEKILDFCERYVGDDKKTMIAFLREHGCTVVFRKKTLMADRAAPN